MKKELLNRVFVKCAALAIVCLMGATSSVKAEVLSSKSKETGDWSQGVTIEASAFKKVGVGDVIAVNVTALNEYADGSYWAVVLRQPTGDWSQLTGADSGNSVTAAGKFYYVINETNVAELQANGLNVTGKYITFDKVEVLYKKVLWSGSLDGTDENWKTESVGQFAVSEGDLFGVTVSAVQDRSGNEEDNTWNGFNINYWDSSANEGIGSNVYTIESWPGQSGVYLYELTDVQATAFSTMDHTLVARYLTITELCTYTALPATITLSETAFPDFTAGTYETVKLTRTLLTGFNTIILPFATTAVELAGTGAYAATIKTTNEANNVLTFVKVDDMEANKPYLIYVPAEVKNPTLSDKTLESVTTESWKYQTWDYGEVNGQRWYLQGNYEPGKDVSGDGIYVVSGENSIATTTTGATLNGLRAYLVNTTPGSDVKQNITFVVEDTTTGISQSMKMQGEDGPMYNLAGQRVGKAVRGIYVVNGKKIVVK